MLKDASRIHKEDRIIKTIIEFIRNEVRHRKSKGVVIGISGGLDSPVVTCIAVMALDPRKVFGLILPDSGITPKGDTRDARNLAENLGIKYQIIEVGNIKKRCLSKLKTIERMRKRDCNNPYPRCDYEYGSTYEEYDPLTGKKTLRFSPPDIGHFFWPEKYTKR